ncbi:Protein CTH-2 [Aphelenchoides avenae]|nr:Protein CTH-2 [Aphelenchus avenae]
MASNSSDSAERKRYKGFGTTAIHAGHDSSQCDMNQVVPPISLSVTYHHDEPGKPKAHKYSRYGNPTRDLVQDNIAALEDAKYCRVYSCGIASCNAVVGLLKTGDHLVSADNIYGGTQSFFREVAIEHHGLEISFVDFSDLENLAKALTTKTKMVWFESPSNPLLEVVDIRTVVDIVKKYDQEIFVVIDNTFMTPFFQRPLKFGVDIVVHSVTKYINGHTDVLMGAVVTNDERVEKHCFTTQRTGGAVPSAFDCYLALRGIKTLHLRMRAHMDNALATAHWLEKHPKVGKVLYPELESHPQHAVHKKQTSGMSGMLSFYLRGGREQSLKFLKALELFKSAVSLGGYESLAEAPRIMSQPVAPDGTHQPGVTDSLIRLSVGCEDKEDLIEDLKRAIEIAFDE